MPSADRLRILFFLHSANLDRLYDCLLEALLARGHRVEVLLEEEARGPGSGGVLARLAREWPTFSFQLPAVPHDPWRRVRRRLRAAADFLRYLEPDYASADALRERARHRAPEAVRTLERPLRTSRRLRRATSGVLRAVEAAVPLDPAVRDVVAARAPDVVMVAPLVSIGSAQGDWIRAADELGIPTVLPVASWDNLSNKGLIKHPPTRTIVWNDIQADEAVRLHGLRRDSVVATGAHSFDHWFGRGPSTSRDQFLERVGLDPAPYVLYVASSRFIAADETGFVEEWVDELRRSGNPRLAELGVVVRPHPLNASEWATYRPRDGRVVVWPRRGALPTDEESRAGFYDSIHHSAAVMGLNTTAMIEAAILGRPALTVTLDRFRATQQGTLHFAYIADDLLHVAGGWDEHLRQLARVLERPDEGRERIDGFVRRFVRPRGLETPAAVHAVEAVEHAARSPTGVPAPSAAQRLLRLALRLARQVRARARELRS